MAPSEMKTFNRMFNRFVKFFPQGLSLTPATVIELAEGYFEHLAELSLEQVSALFDQAMQDCKFMPTIAELRAMAGFVRKPTPQEQIRLKADDVWRRLCEPERNPVTGSYRHYCLAVIENDPIAKICFQEMGGAWAFNKWPVEEIPFRARDFKSSYISLSLANQREQIQQGLDREEASRLLKDLGFEEL